MATSAPRNVPASSPSRNAGAPALFLTLKIHLSAVVERLRAIGFHGHVGPSWRLDEKRRPVCFVKIAVDPQSDTFLDDERRAYREARDILIYAGFIVGGQASEEPTALQISSYHGAVVYGETPTSCPACANGACLRHDSLFHELRDDGPGPVRAPRRLVVRHVQRAA